MKVVLGDTPALPTPRQVEPGWRLVLRTLGGPRSVAGKLARVARALGMYVNFAETGRRIGRLRVHPGLVRMPTRLRYTAGVSLFLTLMLTACPGPGSDELPTADSGGTAAADVCVDVPVVDWDSFGQGFLLEACQGCHASTAADRYGAPEDVNFDTVEEAWRHADEILNVAATADPSMPPRGGVEDDDRVRLRWWLECGIPGS